MIQTSFFSNDPSSMLNFNSSNISHDNDSMAVNRGSTETNGRGSDRNLSVVDEEI